MGSCGGCGSGDGRHGHVTDDGRLRRGRDGGGIHAGHGRDRRRCRNRHRNGGTAAGRRAGRGLHAHVTSLVVDDTRCRRRRSAGRRSCGCSRRLRRQPGLGLPGGIHVRLLLMVIHLVAMLSTYLLAFADWAFSLVGMRAQARRRRLYQQEKKKKSCEIARVAGRQCETTERRRSWLSASQFRPDVAKIT